MTKKLFGFIATAALLAVPAFANTVTQGSSVSPDVFGPITGTVLASVHFSATVGNLTASYTEWVISGDASNSLGGLDFVIQAMDDATSSDGIEHVNNGTYSSLVGTDVGYTTSLNSVSSPAGSIAPTNVTRSNFGAISFAELLSPAQTSDYLVIQTDSKNFQAGALDVSIQDTTSITGPGFSPGPEPMTMGLLGGGLLLLGGVARFRSKKNKA